MSLNPRFLSDEMGTPSLFCVWHFWEGYPGAVSLMIFWLSAQRQTGPKDRCLSEVTT